MSSLLAVEGLRKHFATGGGLFRRGARVVRAVDGVSFAVRVGETLALVGESGCGKSTLARTLLRLVEPTAGRALYWAEGAGEPVDLFALGRRSLRAVRRDLQIVFQDPFGSLNPRFTVRALVGEPLVALGLASGAELEERVAELLRLVNLSPDVHARYPHEFSGGQRQRIGIARALASGPRLVVLDEALSSLDVSVRAQIVNLLVDLRSRLGLAYLFIAHDLSLVRHLADRVAVMYLGRIVEEAPSELLFADPRHPYTRALLASVPEPVPRRGGKEARSALAGDVPSPSDPPSGCSFRTRCPLAEPRCAREEPPLRTLRDGRRAACHLLDELSPPG